MNYRAFNNYINEVMNAIDSQHNRLDGKARITFSITANGLYVVWSGFSKIRSETFAAGSMASPVSLRATGRVRGSKSSLAPTGKHSIIS